MYILRTRGLWYIYLGEERGGGGTLMHVHVHEKP